MGSAVWVQNAGDLLGKELFCIYPEDIFRNNGIYSYAHFCFFRQCMSALCTLSVVFFFFFLILLSFFSNGTFTTEFLCTWRWGLTHLELLKSPSSHLMKEDTFRPSFLGRIPGWEIMVFSLLISSPHLLKHYAFHSVS